MISRSNSAIIAVGARYPRRKDIMTQRKEEPSDKVCAYCGKKLVRKRFDYSKCNENQLAGRLEGYGQFIKRTHCDCYCANMKSKGSTK